MFSFNACNVITEENSSTPPFARSLLTVGSPFASLALIPLLKMARQNVYYAPPITSSELFLSKPIFLLNFGLKPYTPLPIYSTGDPLVPFVPTHPSFSLPAALLPMITFVCSGASAFPISMPQALTNLPLALLGAFSSVTHSNTKDITALT